MRRGDAVQGVQGQELTPGCTLYACLTPIGFLTRDLASGLGLTVLACITYKQYTIGCAVVDWLCRAVPYGG